jgi:class 3 adenylate cyclase/predicted ATPase
MADRGRSMNNIASWLEGLGLGQYTAIFEENAIDPGILPDLTETDLEKLGVALGHRKRMLRAIAGLAAQEQARTIAAPPLAAPVSEGERRQLTVLFCDLVDSTVLAVKLDPEDLSAVIRRFQATCTAIITQAGGHIARYMGDGILAYFGYPQAHEDDAECAARAGLDLVAKVSQLVLPSHEALKVRVGIATGLVVVGETIGEGSSREQSVVGETPNLASRLQGLARPNTVVVASSTRRLLGDAFVCEDLGFHEVKGISGPIKIWRVTGEGVVESRFDALRSASLSQFVGRQNELDLLMGLWQRAKADQGQVALICGEPGIGKSRLSLALLDRISSEPHITIRCQCSPHHVNSPFYPVIRQFEYAARFDRDDSAEVKLNKLDALLSMAGHTGADAPLLAALLSIPTGSRYPASNLTPQQQKMHTISALIRHLLGLARKQPVLFVTEDVHWIDPTTLDLLNRIIDAVGKAPVFCLISFRPEFFPPWLDRSNATMLRINRLARDQVHAMILDVTGGKALPPDIEEQIVSKTDGVPLFIEELTKMVIESGLLRDAGDHYVDAGPLPTSVIPATLQDSLMARLDRLAAVKEIAQVAAVIGREFSYGLLAKVVPTSEEFLQAGLTQLTSAELVFGRGEPPDSTYIFKHALVQDAAYSSLLRSKRQQLHNTIAEALEEHFPDLVETQPELIAHHLAQAGAVRPAIDYLRKAGKRAIERSANTEAIVHLQRGLELLRSLPDSLNHRQVALDLEVMLAQAMIAGRGYAASETMEVLLRAKSLISESTETSQKFVILYGLWACHYVGGSVDMEQVTAAEFLAEAERYGDTAVLCLAHRTLGTTYVTMGEFAAGREHLEQARRLYHPEHYTRFQYGQDIGATVLCYLSWALWHLGFVEQAAAVAGEAVQRAEAISHPHTLVYTLCHARGMMDVFRRRSEDTQRYAGVVMALCSEHEFPFWAAGGQILSGWAATCHGQVEAGVDELNRGLAAWRKTGARLWLPIFLALEAEGHAKAGRNDAASRAIDQALLVSNETGERWAVAEVLRIKAGIVLACNPAQTQEVEDLLTKSLEVARRQQARCWELRTACDLARLWQDRKRGKDALKLLRSVYDQFTEGFGTADLQSAKALIDSLSAHSVVEA